MKTNTKMVAIIGLCMTLLISGGVVASASLVDTDTSGYEIGEKISEINADSSADQNVATINDNAVTKAEFETYKSAMRQTGENYSDAELMDKIIARDVLYDEAVRRDLVATSEEIDDDINFVKETLKQSDQKETAAFINSYISGLGITEDQYWENVRETYKVTLSIGKLKSELKEKYESQFPNLKAGINAEGQFKSFDEYYDNFLNNLISSADIQTDIK